jgi:hypothetical protein
MALFPLGILSAAGGVLEGDFELIETQILTGTQASFVFSNLGTYSTTYKHLQLRSAPKSNSSAASGLGWVRLNGSFNGNTTDSNYAIHILNSNAGGSPQVESIAETSSRKGFGVAARTNENFSANITDILDAFSSTKNTTSRTFSGTPSSTSRVQLMSHLFNNTASITSIEISTEDGSSFVAGSRFSLYGIKG